MTSAARLADLKSALSCCLIRDRHPLRRKLADAADRLKKNQPADKLLSDIAGQVERSRSRADARRAHLPKPQFDD
ncbi:hypothetical protein, partial [Chromobacterium alticapitis]